MSDAAVPVAPPRPPRPLVLGAAAALALLTALNFLNYVDRYVLAAVLEHIRLDRAFAGVSYARLGALQTAFFWSYMLLSPVSGVLGRRVPRRFIVTAGVGLWSLATIASGLARGYSELLAARALIGCGEAGYATVAPALISDLFHRDRRNRMLTIFYLATPVGSALGFVIGGEVAQAAGWRASFLVAGAPGLLLALAALLLPDPARGAQDPDAAPATASVSAALRQLARNRAFWRVTAGTTFFTFAVGGLAFWMPTYFQQARGLDIAAANRAVGRLAVGAGVLGTLGGSLLADRLRRRDPHAYLVVSGFGLLAAAPLAIALPFVPSLAWCQVLLFFAELFVFLNTGPLNTALVDSAPPDIREAAVGLNILFIHLLGDAISPPLLGALADRLVGAGMPRAGAMGFAVAALAVPLVLGGAALLVGLKRNVARRTAG